MASDTGFGLGSGSGSGSASQLPEKDGRGGRGRPNFDRDLDLKPAFAVSGEPNYDRGPAADAMEYLRRVRHEARRLPQVGFLYLIFAILYFFFG